MEPSPRTPLDLRSLQRFYAEEPGSAPEFFHDLLIRVRTSDKRVWIHLLSEADIQTQIQAADKRRKAAVPQPLFGVPFAIKDNIDAAGHPTTAACPDYAYTPEKSATVVDRLCEAGAILVGKTNLDQFATGLVGTRSPYGACPNPFNPEYISGGSSSGSASAVALGLVSFALGTDTAGSGRVPAAFTNTVGLKPTRGAISTNGIVPACRSLDCVSIFALTCDDAREIFSIAREGTPNLSSTQGIPGIRIGVPDRSALEFFGNSEAGRLFSESIERFRESGATVTRIDFEPFARAARLLYEGPWLAERLMAIQDFFDRRPDSLLPVTRTIIEKGRHFSAIDAFRGTQELQQLCNRAKIEWAKMDVLFVPSTPTVYTIAEVNADPYQLNANLGYYTNFVNLMDLCALAVPNGFLPSGVPQGITLIAPAGHDLQLVEIGRSYHRLLNLSLGATDWPMPREDNLMNHPQPAPPPGTVRLAVVGAHLTGQPLNHQLTDRGARLVRTAQTAPIYRLYALPGTTPPKPGLIRALNESGAAIEIEVWELSFEAFGSFVAAIPAPLGIGTLRLEDGEEVKGFLCESYATQDATDISAFGGWRAYLRSLSND